MTVPPLPRSDSGRFFQTYTAGLTTTDIERLFTRDAPEAYRMFARSIDFGSLKIGSDLRFRNAADGHEAAGEESTYA